MKAGISFFKTFSLAATTIPSLPQRRPANTTEQLRPQIRVCMAAVPELLKKENPEYEQS
jgi:hypothetical protein